MRSRQRSVVLLLLVVGLLGVPSADAEVRRGATRRVGNSTDVVTAAIDLSKGAWQDGAARIVALGRSDLFPDSLAGAAIAGKRGPVLFTTGGSTASLVPAVRAEIGRVLPAPSGCDGKSEIAILGGTGAVSPAAEAELRSAGWCVRRYGGATRIETALLIADAVLASGGSSSRVLLARADSWPDSATGSAYAAATGHPVVVTSSGALDGAVAAFLQRVRPGQIVLLGGTGALSPAVEQAAAAIAPTIRVAGTSRDATAVAIAEQLWAPLNPTGVTFVNGFADNGWAYAIAAAVNAALDGAAELFVQAGSIPDSTRGYLERARDTFTIVAGPESLISAAVVASGEASRGIDRPGGAGPMRYRDEVFSDVTYRTDIVYGRARGHDGADIDLLMDVVEPDGDTVTSRPLVIWAHGGGFWGGVRQQNNYLLDELAQRGFVVATIDFRLIPKPGCNGGPFEVCVAGIAKATDDMQAAVRYLASHASTYGIDPARIAVTGFSSGAIMALNVAFSSEEEPDAAAAAAIGVAGWRVGPAFSPGDAPTLLFNGTADDQVPYASAVSTLVQAVQAGLRSILVTYDDAGHGILVEKYDDIVEKSVNFLYSQLHLAAAPR